MGDALNGSWTQSELVATTDEIYHWLWAEAGLWRNGTDYGEFHFWWEFNALLTATFMVEAAED